VLITIILNYALLYFSNRIVDINISVSKWKEGLCSCRQHVLVVSNVESASLWPYFSKLCCAVC